MTTDTLLLPLSEPEPHPSLLPRPGSYTAPTERCIVELTARTGPLATLRARFTTADATLTVDPDPDRWSLSISVRGDSLHVGRPFAGNRLRGRRGLHTSRYPVLRFESQRIEHVEENRMDLHGHWHVRGVPQPACLHARTTERADDRLILLATADLPYRAVRTSSGFTLPRLTPARHLRLLVAADLA
jgi:polyisoprenoid-binding protein YceI